MELQQCIRNHRAVSHAAARYTESMHPPVRLVAIDMDGTLLPTFSQTISAGKALVMPTGEYVHRLVFNTLRLLLITE